MQVHWKQYLFGKPEEHSWTKLGSCAFQFQTCFFQVALSDWLHLCWASEALSGVTCSNLSTGQGTTEPNVRGRPLFLVCFWLGKIPDPVVKYLLSWWPLQKLYLQDSEQEQRFAWNMDFFLKFWFSNHWISVMDLLWVTQRGEVLQQEGKWWGAPQLYSLSVHQWCTHLCGLLLISEFSCHESNIVCIEE